jgi:hypothetical protein
MQIKHIGNDKKRESYLKKKKAKKEQKKHE